MTASSPSAESATTPLLAADPPEGDARFPWRENLGFVAFGLALRIGLALFAADRVPPTADGSFYHVVAERIARGLGYTWLWPDGVVTYAAHYPVGYPALLGGAYALFGASPLTAMLVNAALGALGCGFVHALAWGAAQESPFRRAALLAARGAALFVVLSPTLLGYTAALMTEGVVGTFLLLAIGAVARGVRRPVRAVPWFALAALALGGATWIRPQSLLFAPVLGLLFFPGSALKKLLAAAALSLATIGLCLPWTLRNCDKMERCVFVSANGGWNLLIGTFSEGRGAWVGLEGERVPPECREVFQEAAKDDCFGKAGSRRIREAPLAWLGLVPDKWRVTFDHTASAAEHWSAAGALAERGKWILGALEILSHRLEYLLVLVSVLAARGWRVTRGELVVGGALALGFLGFGAYLGFLGLLAFAAARWASLPLVTRAGLAFGFVTLVTHAIFFGAGRYSLPLVPLLAPSAAVGLAALRERRSGSQEPGRSGARAHPGGARKPSI